MAAVRTAELDRQISLAMNNPKPHEDHTIKQVVILAAGLDTRAWRLSWAHAVTVYELDTPAMLSFKAQMLADHCSMPDGIKRVPLAVDLTDLQGD